MKTDGRLGTRGEEKVEWVLAWHLQAPSSELHSLLSAPAQGEQTRSYSSKIENIGDDGRSYTRETTFGLD